MKTLRFKIIISSIFVFIFSNTSFSMTNDELIEHVLDGESNLVAKFFAQFFDFISGSLFIFYEMIVEYIYIFLFLGYSFWILKYMWDNLIEAGGGFKMGEFSAEKAKDYFYKLFKMIFKTAIIASTILLISPRSDYEKGGVKVQVPPRIIFKYVFDPIIMIGTSSGRYIMNQYTESYVAREKDLERKEMYSKRLIQGNFCRNEINKWSTFDKDGRFQDPRYSQGVDSQFLNDSVKLEFICLIDAFDKLISSFDVYAIDMSDIYFTNFLGSDIGGSILLIVLFLSLIFFIVTCIKKLKFMTLLAWIVPILYISLLVLLIFTNFGFFLLALAYGLLAFYLKIMGGLKLVGNFVIICISYMILPILAGLWIFDKEKSISKLSISGVFDTFKSMSMGIFSLCMAYIIVMTLNESFLSIYYRDNDDILFSVKENLTSGNIEAFTQTGDLMPLFINIFLLIIVTIFLKNTDSLSGTFLLGSPNNNLGDTLSGYAKKAWNKVSKPANKIVMEKIDKKRSS